MRNRMSLLLAFLAAFIFTSPAFAASTGGTAAEEALATGAATEAEAPTAGSDEALADTMADAGSGTTADSKVPDGPAEIGTDEEAMSAVSELVGAAKNGHWGLVIAFSIMLFVYALNRFGLTSKLGPKAIPWVAAGTGLLGYVAASLMVEGMSIVDGVTNGVKVGAEAVGLWELLFKHVLGSKPASS